MDARNRPDLLVYQVDKTLTESKDKLPDDVQNEVRGALDETRKSLEKCWRALHPKKQRRT